MDQPDDAANATLGASISSFMQASEADANASVDNGMFEARLERSNGSDRPVLVQERAEQLDTRLQQLRQERQEILESTEDGELTVAERARVAQLTARIKGLEQAIEQTETAAKQVGIETSELTRMRQEAENMTGPPGVETGLDDIDRAHEPPEDRPGTVDQGNETDNDVPPTPPGNGTAERNESNGPPDAPGNADNRSQQGNEGNETETQEDDEGNESRGNGEGNDEGNESAQGDGAQNGQDDSDRGAGGGPDNGRDGGDARPSERGDDEDGPADRPRFQG